MTKPAHIAIIMDGNGRWAKERDLPRVMGHVAGVEALHRTVRACGEMGLDYLTIYAFSSENWARPQDEVNDLMGLLKKFIEDDLKELHEADVKVHMIGSREGVPSDILLLVDDAQILTKNNKKLQLNIAFNYGARDEITRAVKKIAKAVKTHTLKVDEINEEVINDYLDTSEIPDPDLIIRTSGEQRLSNFLLWQAAYSEFIFMPCMWPDFDNDSLNEALDEFSRRSRRFGGLEPI